MKKAGKSNKVIRETLGIKNDSQIYTWMRWYENDELHRFRQPLGKQYTYGKGMEQLSEVEQLRLQVELLKVSQLGKTIDKVSLIKLVEEYKKTCPVSAILAALASNAQPSTVGKRTVRSLRRKMKWSRK